VIWKVPFIRFQHAKLGIFRKVTKRKTRKMLLNGEILLPACMEMFEKCYKKPTTKK